MATQAKPASPSAGGAARRRARHRPVARALGALAADGSALFRHAVLYWATRTQANTFDAVSYANQIAHLYPRTGDPRWLFHPHHLLFNALGYVLWRAARAWATSAARWSSCKA